MLPVRFLGVFRRYVFVFQFSKLKLTVYTSVSRNGRGEREGTEEPRGGGGGRHARIVYNFSTLQCAILLTFKTQLS